MTSTMNSKFFERIPFKQEQTEQGAQGQAHRQSIIEGESLVRGTIGHQRAYLMWPGHYRNTP